MQDGGIGRNFLSATSQAKAGLLIGRCQIKNERGLQSLKHHNKHKRRGQICPSTFLILKSIRNSKTQETGHFLMLKTSALEGPSNNTDYHKASIFSSFHRILTFLSIGRTNCSNETRSTTYCPTRYSRLEVEESELNTKKRCFLMVNSF